MKNSDYKAFAMKKEKKSKLFTDCFWAFFIGGAICAASQALLNLYVFWGIADNAAKTLVSVTLIFLSCLFTGIGWYDKLAQTAGAGTLVPITGFANAMASPAIDNKAEGYVLGLGAKMFVIAGPVIVYGVLASIGLGLVMCIALLYGYDLSACMG